jgi:hypothetical protein
MRAFDAAHWDEQAGMYRDAPGAHSIHTNALALLALDLGRERAMGVADRMLASPAEPIGSPYFEGFALRGLCRWGRHRDALARIAQKWGPMIDAGATTFWEHYSGRASLCHAWSSEPTALLSRDILGVSWSAPERLVRIAPNPGALTWAQGVVPLPCGDVTLRWDATADGLRLHLSAPEAVTVALDLPAAAGAVLLVDGQEARDAVAANERIRARLRGGAHAVVIQARERAESSRAGA